MSTESGLHRSFGLNRGLTVSPDQGLTLLLASVAGRGMGQPHGPAEAVGISKMERYHGAGLECITMSGTLYRVLGPVESEDTITVAARDDTGRPVWLHRPPDHATRQEIVSLLRSLKGYVGTERCRRDQTVLNLASWNGAPCLVTTPLGGFTGVRRWVEDRLSDTPAPLSTPIVDASWPPSWITEVATVSPATPGEFTEAFGHLIERAPESPQPAPVPSPRDGALFGGLSVPLPDAPVIAVDEDQELLNELRKFLEGQSMPPDAAPARAARDATGIGAAAVVAATPRHQPMARRGDAPQSPSPYTEVVAGRRAQAPPAPAPPVSAVPEAAPQNHLHWLVVASVAACIGSLLLVLVYVLLI